MHSRITFAVKGHALVQEGASDVITNDRKKQNIFCLPTICCTVPGLPKTADLGTGLRLLICACTMLV